MENHEAFITRHADKAKDPWEIDEEKLRAYLPGSDAELILTVLKNEFKGLKEIPLRIEGLKRSLRLGDEILNEVPKQCVLVVIDSGKDRAHITREIATARIAQKERTTDRDRRIDMLSTDAKELTGLLTDASDATWTPYAEMIKNEGISESEAISRWLRDMNAPEAAVDPKIHPHEAAERYRVFLDSIREKITSDAVPVVIVGIGHSGSLGQIRYEANRSVLAEQTPQFCEIYVFDEANKLVRTKEVALDERGDS